MAITKFDQFDFLIDIVPRDELKPPKRQVYMSFSQFLLANLGPYKTVSNSLGLVDFPVR